MNVLPTLVGILLFAGVVFFLVRSRNNKNRLLSAAARREKHAPKESISPRRLNSRGEQIDQEVLDSNQNEDEQFDSNVERVVEEDLPSNIIDSSRQVNDLNEQEKTEYEQRDKVRDEHILSLSLLVEDLFDEELKEHVETDVEPEKEVNDFESSSIELRNSWIEQNEEPLNEHASLVEQEEIGSGIQYLDAEAIENDDIEQRLEREGGKTGEVQISLTWDDYNDLDLHIFCPSGERIYFNNKTSECGGELDVDMNVRPTSDNAVENVVWIENAPSGKYKVGVHFYKHHEKDGTTPTCDFRLRATIHGESRDFSGSITHGQAMQMVTSFTLKSETTSQ
ncbi:MAG: hypothetical protein DWC08_07815 [Candidatus Poseidoniales archaeon]|nr:MAG: hypothetical protein DWC08_07815 [Candidatus Poseidoniales archaeon]